MNKIIIAFVIAIAGIGITIASQNIQPLYAQEHGDEVSSAAEIIGPEISTIAKDFQKVPGDVSSFAQIIGPEISEIASSGIIGPE